MQWAKLQPWLEIVYYSSICRSVLMIALIQRGGVSIDRASVNPFKRRTDCSILCLKGEERSGAGALEG